MKVEEIVSIFSICGFHIKKAGIYHFTNQHGINYSFPTLLKLSINCIPLKSIKWKYLITIILTDLRIKNTYEFILHTSDYSLDKFARKTRNRIRKSLKNCMFKRPILEDLLNLGLKINQKTCKRQHRRDSTLTNVKKWNKYISSLYSQENIIILGAYYANRMVGYIVSFELEGKYIIQHAFIDKEDSEITAPMNGLIYFFVNQLIEKNESVKISYGLDSFLPLPELTRFKSNMLFKRVPVSRLYLINPLILPFIRLIISYHIYFLKQKRIRNSLVRNIIHLYQGYRLLSKEYKLKKPYSKFD